MRGVRRIGDTCRFGSAPTDSHARRAVGMPSIDCILARARLRYFARILRNMPPTLLALLGARHAGKPLPW
eukprot:11105925-Heterocapsa_arctica.AAC.1